MIVDRGFCRGRGQVCSLRPGCCSILLASPAHSAPLYDFAWRGIHGAGWCELFCAARAEFSELASAREEHALERAYGGVLALGRGVEATTDLVEILGKGGDAVVECAAERADLVGIF